MSSFNKIFAICVGLLFVSCTTEVGNVRKDQNPDAVADYVVAGALFDTSKIEKRSYQTFTKDQCTDKGYQNVDGYSIGMSSGMFIGISPTLGIPFTDVTKTVKIWCKK